MEHIIRDTIRIQPPPYPPSANGFPIIGAIPGLLREQLDFLERARSVYGDIYTLNMGTMSMVMLNRPEHAQHVLVDNVRNYAKGGPIWDSVRSLAGNGLVTSEGDFWRRQRRMMQPHFHRQRLGALTEIMVNATERGLTSWGKYVGQNSPMEASAEFAHITMSVIMRTMFGADIDEDEFADVSKKLTFMLDYMLPQALTYSLPSWVPVPKRAQYQQALRDIDAFIYGVIANCRRNLSNNLISMLIEAVDDESGDQMTNQQLRDEVITIFAAGYETTSLTLSWVLHFLTQQPEIAEHLRQEVDTVLGPRAPTFEDLPRLTYTRQVLQEAMRLYPPAYFLPRTAVEEDVIDGYRIRAGQMLAITMYTIHRHPDFWESPAVFDPERFSPQQSKLRHTLAWMPFGAGQRMCLGRDFSFMEGTIILAMLMQRYNVSAPEGFVAKPKLSMTLRPSKGVLVNLQNR